MGKDGGHETSLSTLAVLVLLCGGAIVFHIGSKVGDVKKIVLAEPRILSGGNVLLHNTGFDVCFSTKRQRPKWVHYLISQSDRNSRVPSGINEFYKDTRVASSPKPSDISPDLHWRALIPPVIAAKYFGKDSSVEAMFTTSAVPANDAGDRLWNGVLHLLADIYPPLYGRVEVLCGPLYNTETPTTDTGIPLPYAFFVVLTRPDGETLGFILPQEPAGDAPNSYISSIEKIEKAAGQVLFPEMDTEIKKKIPAEVWEK